MKSCHAPDGHAPDVDYTDPAALLRASSSVPKVLAALPRWILATRTSFSKFLARTFHLQCRGVVPDTVVFPLPFADYGIFHSGGEISAGGATSAY